MHHQINYKIATDESIYESLYRYTPAITKLLQQNYNKIQDNPSPKKMIEKLLADIVLYPHVPQFKNQLQITYVKLKMYNKAIEMDNYILAEHPDYLFGKINKALRHYDKAEYAEMLTLLGEDLDIQKLYPYREIFHREEVMNYMMLATLYINATKHDWQQVQTRLDIMNEIAPHHPAIKQTNDLMMKLNLEAAKQRFDEEQKTALKPNFAFVQSLPTTTTKPALQHKILYDLYDDVPLIEDDFYVKVQAINTNELLVDLQAIINDSIARFKFIEKNFETEDSNFIMHTCILLADVDHPKSLPMLLQVLLQGEEYLDFYLDDFITESFWSLLYRQSENRIDELFAFLYLPNIYTYSKTEVVETIAQIGLHQPIFLKEIEKQFYQLINHFITHYEDETLMDSIVNAAIAGHVVDLQLKDLYGLIKIMYDKKLIALSFAGSFDDLLNLEFDLDTSKREVKSTETLNDEIRSWIMSDDEEDDDWIEDIESIFSSPKIGRNDPCPCGSGKKYKKCCGTD
ncbi:MAG: hypothetical protein RIQ33_1753 [Bacteroidota bacterium]|jgi:hypothetical protein